MKSQRSSEGEDVAEACEVPGNDLNMNRINLYSNDVGAVSVVEGKRDSLTLSASSDSVSSSGCVVSSSMSPSQPLRTVNLDPGSSAPDVAEAKESPGKSHIGKSGLMSKMSNMDMSLEDGMRRQQAAKEASHTISTILTQSLRGNKDSAPSNPVDPQGVVTPSIPFRDEVKSSIQAYPVTHSHSHAELKGTGDFILLLLQQAFIIHVYFNEAVIHTIYYLLILNNTSQERKMRSEACCINSISS